MSFDLRCVDCGAEWSEAVSDGGTIYCPECGAVRGAAPVGAEMFRQELVRKARWRRPEPERIRARQVVKRS